MNCLLIYFFTLLCCLFSILLPAQRTGFQFSINQINLNNTKEEVTRSSDTTDFFNPKYKRGGQDFGLTTGVTYRTNKCIFALKIGYFQNYFRNTETEAFPATYSITEVKNKNYGIYWGLGVSKTFYSSKKLFLNYGVSLDGTLDIKNYISIRINHFDATSNFLAKSDTDYDFPGSATISLSPLWSFNYFVYRNISLGIEYRYGLQFTRINGQINYTNLITDNTGMVLRERYQTVAYTFNKFTFAQALALNFNFNLNQQR